MSAASISWFYYIIIGQTGFDMNEDILQTLWFASDRCNCMHYVAIELQKMELQFKDITTHFNLIIMPFCYE